jgi:hypothetical protein
MNEVQRCKFLTEANARSSGEWKPAKINELRAKNKDCVRHVTYVIFELLVHLEMFEYTEKNNLQQKRCKRISIAMTSMRNNKDGTLEQFYQFQGCLENIVQI